MDSSSWCSPFWIQRPGRSVVFSREVDKSDSAHSVGLVCMVIWEEHILLGMSA